MNELIKNFTITGLYGYKNISLDFGKKNTIVIAENGTGKTTFISTLYSVLNGDIEEVMKLKCDSISLEFYDNDKFYIDINELDSRNFNEEIKHSRIFRFIRSAKMKHDIIAFIINGDISSIDRTSWFNQLLRTSSLSPSAVFNEINRLIERVGRTRNHDLINETEKSKSKEALFLIKRKMRDFDIIYLPTYRRIEKSNLKEELGITEEDRESRTTYFSNGDFIERRYTQKPSIEFGLFDVERKLKELSTKIERKSSAGYRALSASMIEDIMTESISFTRKSKLPEIEDLSRFLNRVVSKETENKNDELISQIIDKLQNIRKVKKENPLLLYFLDKLNAVIGTTKELESKIENFVFVCNKYLELSDDSKIFTFDMEKLNVVVKDKITDSNIKLEDLSSGEKQVISIMSHFYLDDTNRKKIFLIDEPELSLSTEWQRHILIDIENSDNLLQMLAITHSPFIFNNDLKKNVKKLSINKIEIEKTEG
ncbi:AAA family ATPase [Proteus vulgaris]|uniref:AAA family ATPase n=1 Tax=Proteus vulgaris TaxID=585 RepID=UPI0018C788CB|nr:AAA family ATPase [Proteus vulgaris]MBG5969635.1 ATP-binding protein [Proteus vulgaris]